MAEDMDKHLDELKEELRVLTESFEQSSTELQHLIKDLVKHLKRP